MSKITITMGGCQGFGVVAKLEAVLRGFAAAYADHPDYRPEWGP